MEEEQIKNAVLAYLQKKGYRQAELAFQEEDLKSTSSSFKTDTDIANQILRYSKLDNVPASYKEAYSKLRNWVHSSLDLYKHELLRILYPVFLHCFMDLVAKGFQQEARSFFQNFKDDYETLHLRDLQKLEGVLSSDHLQEMELARSLRENKVTVKMCQFSFDLLLQYLHNTDSSLMLGVVNEHINLQVTPGQPTSWSDDDMGPLLGKPQEGVSEVNTKEIKWGMLEDSLEDKAEKELAGEAEKAEAEGKEAEGDEARKKMGEAGKAKKLKKDKVSGTAGKSLKTETTSTNSGVPRVKSELPMAIFSEESERRALDDLRNRARLSSSALPSVSFYTFLNTHNSLNCASISTDGAMVVGGFADSSLKVWDMTKSTEQHSSFSSVRLWNIPLTANLVCYKGHNYPVWDVQFSPVGHYFASASHDRTARVWSMDRAQPLRIMVGHFSDVDCVQWHVNCNYIATGSSDKTVRLWDVATGECMRLFTGHRGMVTCLSMSPDGRYMASGDEDGAIMLWDLGSGQSISPLMGHTGSVWTLDFSCEGSLLASGSADNSVRIWDVIGSLKPPRIEEKNAIRRLRLLKTLPTKATPVYSLRFSKRNLLFAAGAFNPAKKL
ncbi:hypothetical protein KP509_30G020600 [Ceratopteris richardii]|uniref:TFIID subunit TAF5 NTD2 domain-containing protein n=1 Tax=Ceratopteris richardii TaxID=49495 RepID=A0A8T2R0G4_CERRI|nr:hypothetical protein KP509_30G020600 [Ceratopteris richardii]